MPLCTVVVCAIVGVFLSPLLVKAILGVIGFGAAGPIAGSFAAWIQSLIGNVIAGSLFATVQSFAMGGCAILLKIIMAIGAFIGAAFGATFF